MTFCFYFHAWTGASLETQRHYSRETFWSTFCVVFLAFLPGLLAPLEGGEVCKIEGLKGQTVNIHQRTDRK